MEFKEIDISQIIVRENSVRTENLNEGIEDLAESIKIVGLLQPIIVTKNSNGNFMLLSGQRRCMAYNFLNKRYPGEGFQKIICNVIEPSSELDVNAFSISESLTQLPMTLTDIIDACDTLFKKYNDSKIVAEKLGISMALVHRYVKFARLPKFIQENLGSIDKNPKTAINLAVDAADALNYALNGNVSEQKVFELAMKLGEKKKNSQEEYKKLKQAAEENPEYSLEQIEENSEKIRTPKMYNIILDSNTTSIIDALAEKEGLLPEEVLANTIEDILGKKLSENND